MTQISSNAPVIGQPVNISTPTRRSTTESPPSHSSTVSGTPDYSPTSLETTESFLKKIESRETNPGSRSGTTGNTTELERSSSSPEKMSFLKTLVKGLRSFANSIVASLTLPNRTLSAARIARIEFTEEDLVIKLLLKDKLSQASAFAVLDRLEDVYADMSVELIDKIAASKAARTYRADVFALCMDIQNEKRANPNAALPFIDDTRFTRMRTVGHLYPDTLQLINNTLDPDAR